MKIFITTHFDPKDQSESLFLNSFFSKIDFEPFSFILSYPKPFLDPKQMMDLAKEEISKCDILLFDASIKSTGRAIEVGIAYSLGKKIIVIAKRGTEIRDTLKGVSDLLVEYENLEDIKQPILDYVKKL